MNSKISCRICIICISRIYGVLRSAASDEGAMQQNRYHASRRSMGCHKSSPGFSTFEMVLVFELSRRKWLQFIVPHPVSDTRSFRFFSETAIFAYKCDNFYNKESEAGVLWNDLEKYRLEASSWKVILSRKYKKFSPRCRKFFWK